MTRKIALAFALGALVLGPIVALADFVPSGGGGGGGAPTGAAGGSLAGTYPNPTIVTGGVSQTAIAFAPIAGAAATATDATTITTWGPLCPNNTPQGATAVAPQADDDYVQFTAAAITNGTGAVYYNSAGYNCVQPRWKLKMLHRMRLGQITSVRYAMYAVASGANNPTTTDATTAKAAYVRFSTSVPDTNFMCCSGDGTASSCDSIGVAAAANTSYDVTLDWSGNNVLRCCVGAAGVGFGGGSCVSHTTNLPPSTDATPMALAAGAYSTGVGTAAVLQHAKLLIAYGPGGI